MRRLPQADLCMVLVTLCLARICRSFQQPLFPMPSSPRRSSASTLVALTAATTQQQPETPQKRKRSSNAPPAVVTPVSNGIGGGLTSEAIELINPSSPFECLGVTATELRPSRTLTTGQCFHWTAVSSEWNDVAAVAATTNSKTSAWGTHDATEWIGTLRYHNESVIVAIRETPTSTLYRALTPTDFDVKSMLQDYFQLNETLSELYDEWSNQCPRLETIAACLPGVRIVDQDPFECLLSFICSSNNNIPRITKMLSAIRQEYGSPLLTVGGSGNHVFYSFPSLETLRNEATEQRLRELGLGYRAKYIMETIRILTELGGESYLQELRLIRDPLVVQEKLMQFSGVGRKVADCVALFSLQQDSAIPVDVHVWNIARRDYDTDRLLENVKSITPTVYKTVGDMFRNRFTNKSGWAHSLLFVAELPSFRAVLPPQIVQEMDVFRADEKARKKGL